MSHLVKYMTATCFLDDLLFRFTQPSALNDPYEALPKVRFGEFSEEDYEQARVRARGFGALPLSEHMLRALMSPSPSGRMDEKVAPGLWPYTEPRLRAEPFDTIEELDRCVADRAVELCWHFANDNLGVFCLTDAPSEPMWAYYTQNAGLMVRFDPAHGFFKGHVRPVTYSNRPIFVSVNNGLIRIAGQQLKRQDILAGIVRDVPPEFLLRKGEGWSHEAERRMVALLANASLCASSPDANGYPVYLFRIPGTAIHSIMFGYRTSASTIADAVRRIVKNPELTHIELWTRTHSHKGVAEQRIL